MALIIMNCDFYLIFLPCLLSTIFCQWKRKSVAGASVLRVSLFTVIILFFDFAAADIIYRYVAQNNILGINAAVWTWTISILLAMLGGAIVCWFAGALVRLRYCRFREFISVNAFGMAIFIYLVLQLAISMPCNINGWASCWYVTDYSMGFGPRFLLGMLMKAVFGPYVSETNAVLVYTATLVCVFLCISILLNKLLKRAKTEHKAALVFLAACWLFSPGSIAALWTGENFGRLETYTLAATMIGIAGFVRIKNLNLKYLVITVFAVLSVAIYQGYVFLYYPMILILIIGDILQAGKVDKKKLTRGLINFSLTSLVFVWFQFFAAQTRYANAEEMSSSLGTMTDLAIAGGALDYELFSPLINAYQSLNAGFYLNEFPREKTILACLMALPVIVLFTALIVKVYKTMKENKVKVFHTPYIYCVAACFAVLPQFIFNVDWGRWFVAIASCGFFSLFYLYFIGFPEIRTAMEALQRFIIRNKVLAVCAVLYLSLWSKFQGRFFSVHIYNLWEWLKLLLGVAQ